MWSDEFLIEKFSELGELHVPVVNSSSQQTHKNHNGRVALLIAYSADLQSSAIRKLEAFMSRNSEKPPCENIAPLVRTRTSVERFQAALAGFPVDVGKKRFDIFRALARLKVE